MIAALKAFRMRKSVMTTSLSATCCFANYALTESIYKEKSLLDSIFMNGVFSIVAAILIQNNRATAGNRRINEMTYKVRHLFNEECRVAWKDGLNLTVKELVVAANAKDAEIAQLKAQLDRIQALVDEQANDEGLWFKHVYITEDVLQQALRKLHAVIEDK